MHLMESSMSGSAGAGDPVVVGFPHTRIRARKLPDPVRPGGPEAVATASPDYLPIACNDAVAMWILDQVRRSGSLDLDTAIAKVSRLFGERFTVEVGRGAPALRKGVLLAIRELSKGKVGFDRRERCFRPK